MPSLSWLRVVCSPGNRLVILGVIFVAMFGESSSGLFGGSSGGLVWSHEIGLGGGYSSDFGRGHEIRHEDGRDNGV